MAGVASVARPWVGAELLRSEPAGWGSAVPASGGQSEAWWGSWGLLGQYPAP